MEKRDIIEAYCKIRTIDNTISDDVLDFMKQCALEKFSLTPPSAMDKQDKTAEQCLEDIGAVFEETPVGLKLHLETNVIRYMKFYAAHRTAELEAKIKALEEQLEAAEVVMDLMWVPTTGDGLEAFYEALEKYQSLKK